VGPGAAADAGLRTGDVVLAVDGHAVRDVIDWWWLTDEPAFMLSIERDGARLELEVERDSGEPLGVSFEDVVFDGVRECVNACQFCFVSQLPTGLRPSLYVRDDDFRLSFLSGNFVTLTNLVDADVARIIEQRLSPLHVSVHAVDPAVRGRLVCPTAGDRTLEIIDTLGEGGISLHVQIVLVPDVNDADVLTQTLAWLAGREHVMSVGIVPMGYTAHQTRFAASFSPERASSLIAQIGPWQERMRDARGEAWVYAADEFYLNACVDVPDADAYDDFAQFENGIGMVRAFLDEFAGAASAGAPVLTVVTGTLFAPVLVRALADAGCGSVRVLPVENRLFGGNVSVTGLLGGADILAGIAADGATGTYLVPDVVVNSDGLLLDDVPADQLAGRAGCDVRVIGGDGASLAAALDDT
jgi:putative radical SAM enzyme (TIGR03279 family)